MNDKYDKEAEELLPCAWANIQPNICIDPVRQCWSCQKRPAVAARLRVDGERVERYRERWLKAAQEGEELAKAQVEIERVTGLAGLYLIDMEALRAQLAQVQKLSQAVIDTDTGPDMNFEALEVLKEWLAANREGK